jgi:hypothetical protein
VERYEPILKYMVLATLAGGIIWFVWRQWKERN